MVMLAVLLPWTAFGQDPQPSPTQTLYDGVATNSAVPIQGLYCDEGVKCEFVIPATQLEWVEDASITALKFYLSESSELQANFTVFVKEVGTTALTAYTGLTGATTVYSGPVSFNADDELVIPFSNSYAYNGGNLLIGFYQNGTCDWSRTRFYGTAQTYASAWQGYGNSAGSGVMFLPTVTLEYIPPQGTLAEMITIGSNDTTHWALPLFTGMIENLSQQIYTASELGAAGIIESIDFFYYDESAQTRHVDVFMVGTDKDAFTDYYDWIPVSADNLVYRGDFTFEPGAWNSIELDNPFNYNGSQNVAILMYNHESGQISAPNPLFRTFYTTQLQALDVYSGWYTYDTANLTSIQATEYSDYLKNQIRVTKGNPSCPRPLNLAVNYTGGTTAVVSWTSEASAFELMVNGNVTNVNGNSYTLNNLDLGTVYELKIRANCGADGHSTWSKPIQFTTDFCMPEDKCGIIFELFNNGDGWNGNAIQVADAASNIVLATVTMGYEDNHIETIPVCDGQELSFTWMGEQYFDGAYTVYDANNTELFSGNGSYGLPSSYTVSCPACWTPMNIDVDYSGGTTAVVSWISNASSVEIMLNGTVIPNVSTNPYTLSNLIPNTANEVKIRANCGAEEYSNWSKPVVFTTSEDQCELIMNLLCSSGYGWHGNAIVLVDATTDVVIDSLTFESGEAVYKNPTVCDGQVISFEWVNGDYPADTYYYLYDAYYNPITSGWAGFNLPENYTAHCDPSPCPVPYYLNYSYTNDSTVAIYWSSDATVFDIQINGTVYQNVTNPYSLSVTPGTVYEVQVRAACGGGEYSYWSAPLAFSTECLPENQCELSYNLHSTSVYGWNGSIRLVDAATGNNLDDLTLQGISESSGTIFVCDGQEISFLWQSEDYGNDAMASYEFYDLNNELIFNGSAGNGLLTSYTVNCAVAPCQIPVGIAVDYTEGTTAEVSWTSDASSFDVKINGTVVTNVDSDYYVLSNLTLGTTYEVQVRANCDMDGYSNWSAPVQFTTSSCSQMCIIRCDLHDSFGDGWNGCAIHVIDAQTDEELAKWTIQSGYSFYGYLPICQGREIRFVWEEGYYPGETSYEIYDYNDDLIFSGSAGSEIVPLYLVDCSNCHVPMNLEVDYSGGTAAEVYWTSEASSFDIMVDGTVVATVDTNYYLLSNLVLGTSYEVKVRANCGVDENSIWSAPVTFQTDLCMPEDRCEIYYDLYSQYSNSWYGNAIQVIDVQTNQVLATWTMTNGEGASGSLHVCQGQELRFSWLNGDCCSDETYYEIYDYDDELVFSGSAGSGLLSSYMVSCVPVLCDRPDDLAIAGLTASSASVTWSATTDAAYNLRYRESIPATIILNVGSTASWNGTGCQLLLDANASVDPSGYETSFSYSNPVYQFYNEFEYKMPCYAEGVVFTSSVVPDNSSLTLQIPAGLYDWVVCVPTASYIYMPATENDYLFEPGKTYEFTVTYVNQMVETMKANGNYPSDSPVSIDISGGDTPQGDVPWTVVNNVTPPYTINGLTESSCYEVQLQAICNGINESFWSPSLPFSTTEICPMPILSSSDVTANSAVLNWTAIVGQNSWQICLNGDENNLQTVYVNSYTFTGLTELTSYTVKVRANCGSDGFSDWSNDVTFTTMQAPASLPYETSFENTCDWVLVNGSNTNAWTWGAATSNSGKKALYISNDGGESNTYNTNDNSTRVYAAKTFTFDADVYNLSFDWRAYGDNYDDYLSVFLTTEDKLLIPDYDTDPTYDNDVRRLVNNQELKGVADWQTKNIEVNIPEAGTYKLVFMWVNNGYDGNQHPAALDNVSIKRVTCITPENLACSDLTASSTTLSWSAPATQTSWDICLNNDENNLITATSNPFTLTGLSELTAYTVKIRANCGTEDGYSNWCNPISFKTIQIPADLPYHTTFEDTCDWVLVNGSYTNAWCWGTRTNNTDGGERAIYISYDGGPSWYYNGNSTSTVYATKTFNFEAGDYRISFDWAANGESGCDYVRAVLVPASVTLDASYSLPSGLNTTTVPQGWIAADGGSSLRGRDYWSTSSSTVTVPTAGAYMLVFVWRNDYSGGYQHPGAIDNVYIQKYCTQPSNLDYSDLTFNSVKISWTAPADQNEWEIRLNGDNDNLITADSIPFVLTGLQPATPYTVSVRAVCGYEVGPNGEELGYSYSNWSEWSLSFTTVAPKVYFYEGTGDCDVVSIQGFPVSLPTATISCSDWTFAGWAEAPVNETTTAPVTLYAAGSAYAPIEDIRLYAIYTDGTSYNSFPACVTTDLDVTEGFETYAVGVMPDANGHVRVKPTGWTVVTQYEPYALSKNGRPWVQMEAPFAHSGDYCLRLDSLTMLAMPKLGENISFENLMMELYVRQPYDFQQIEVGVISDLTNPESFELIETINNLYSAVNHRIVDFSNYSGTGRYIAFRNTYTEENGMRKSFNYLDDIVLRLKSLSCGIAELPYTQNFDTLTDITEERTGVQPECWTEAQKDANYAATYQPQLFYTAAYAHSGAYTLLLDGRCIYAMPELKVPDKSVQDVRLEFYVRQYSADCSLEVGVMSNLNDANSFVALETVSNDGAPGQQRHVVDFGQYADSIPSGAKYIAFRNIYNGTWGRSPQYIDDISLTERVEDNCGITMLPYTQNFDTLTDITENRTGVQPECWTEAKKDANYAVAYEPQLFHEAAYAHSGDYSLLLDGRCIYAMPEFKVEGKTIGDVQLEFYVRQSSLSCLLQVGVMSNLNDANSFIALETISNNGFSGQQVHEVDFGQYADSIPEDAKYIAFRNIYDGTWGRSPHYIDDVKLTERMDCGITELPYTQNFDTLTNITKEKTGVQPECWTEVMRDANYAATHDPQLVHASSYAHSGAYTLMLDGRCIYAMPEIKVEGKTIGEIQMEFYVRQYSANCLLQVGVMSNLNDASSFVALETVSNDGASGQQMHVVNFSQYADSIPEGAKYIAFRNIYNGTWGRSINYIDDITLTSGEAESKIFETSDESVIAEIGVERYLEGIAVYPNPTAGELHIGATDVQKVECYNLMGKLVAVYDNENTISLDNLASGVYTLRITLPQGVTMRKVVKR